MKKLERGLSLPAVIAIAMGSMLGSGIFVLPGLAAAMTGPSVWAAYLLAGICVLPAAVSKSELATAMPESGGTYVYIERTFGPLFGTVSGLGLWVSLLLKSSFALIGFGAYLSVFSPLPLKPTALIMLGLIVLLNITGVKKVGQAQLVIVAICIVSLLCLALGGFITRDVSLLTPAFTAGSDGFVAATAFVFVSYAGVTKVAAIGEEIRDPGRTLPLAVLLSLLCVGTLYGLVVYVLVANVPISLLQNDLHPVYTFAKIVGGPTIGILAAVLGVLTMTSMANAGVLAASRFPFAMSRDKLLPSILQQVHPRFLTPVSCIILSGAFMALAICFLDVKPIAKLASGFTVLMFMSVNACIIVLRETAVQWYKPTYRAPLYPWMQIFGILSGLALMIVLGKMVAAAAIALTVIGIVVYYLYGYRQSGKRAGVLKLYGRRAAMFIFRSNRKKAPRYRKSTDTLKMGNVDGILSEDASVVVPLFGHERCPEMLVEVGAALADGKKVQAVYVSELPYQTVLDALSEDNHQIMSLNRRLSAMAQEEKVDLDFDAVVTHELIEAVQDISEMTHCKWLVMGWEGRSGYGLVVRNPVGWLITHLSCNLALFRDSGIRYIRQVLVYPEPGHHDRLVTSTADHLAGIYNAELTFVRVVPENASEETCNSQLQYINELAEHCGANTHSILLESNNPIEAVTHATSGYDLLVTGSQKSTNLLRVILGTSKDKLTRDSACSVLRLTNSRGKH